MKDKIWNNSSYIIQYIYISLDYYIALAIANALKFPSGRFQCTIETNIFIEILILRFILNKGRLKNKKTKKSKKQNIGVASYTQTLAKTFLFQN